jgi:hypothetical protein
LSEKTIEKFEAQINMMAYLEDKYHNVNVFFILACSLSYHILFLLLFPFRIPKAKETYEQKT